MEYTQYGLNILLCTPDDLFTKKWIFRIDCIPHHSSSMTIEELETQVSHVFRPYQNKSIKEISSDVKIEKIANFFLEKVKKVLNDNYWVLTFLEVSVPPRLTYSINLISHNNNLNKPKRTDNILYEKPYIDNHTKPLQTNNPLCNIMRSTENSVTYSSQIDNEVTKIINRMSH